MSGYPQPQTINNITIIYLFFLNVLIFVLHLYQMFMLIKEGNSLGFFLVNICIYLEKPKKG